MFGFGGMAQWKQWNNDPNQHEFIRLLIAEADGTSFAGATNFICRQDWRAKEIRNRIIHALRAVKQIAEPAVYNGAKEIGRRLTLDSYRLD
jgi:hypothetical protein